MRIHKTYGESQTAIKQESTPNQDEFNKPTRFRSITNPVIEIGLSYGSEGFGM